MSSRLLLALGLCSSSVALGQQVQVLRWPQGARSACSVTFDDNCTGQFSIARPLLDSLGLPATFFVNPVASPCNQIDWTQISAAAQTGHEIGSHSETHPRLRQLDSAAATYELYASADTLERRLPRQAPYTLAWPYGEGASSAAPDARLRRIAARRYLGARAAGSGRGFDAVRAYLEPFYNRPGASYSFQTGAFLMNAGLADTLSRLLARSEADSGWCTLLYHAIELGGYNNVPTTELRRELVDLRARRHPRPDSAPQPTPAPGRTWVATYKQALQATDEYRRTRVVYSNLSTEPNTRQWRLVVDDSLDNQAYNQPLTLRILLPPGRLSASRPIGAYYLTGGGPGLPDILPVPFRIYQSPQQDILELDWVPSPDSLVFDIATAARARLATLGLRLVPQPAGSMVSLSWASLAAAPGKVDILTLAGQHLQTHALRAGNTSIRLSTASLASGVYLVRLQVGGVSEATRLVVE